MNKFNVGDKIKSKTTYIVYVVEEIRGGSYMLSYSEGYTTYVFDIIHKNCFLIKPRSKFYLDI